MLHPPQERIAEKFSHMAHLWMSYGRCNMPGSPMGWSEVFPRRWTG